MWNFLYYIWNYATCSCESGKCLASIIDDSVITSDKGTKSYDEDVEARLYDETKAIPTNFNEKKVACKRQNLYILLAFLITIALLMAVSIYSYSIKYWAKRKQLLPFHNTNHGSRKIIY